MKTATQEAQRLQHEYVGTEHILLGLVNEDGGMAAKVLKSLRIDVDEIRRDVDRLTRIDAEVDFGDIERLAQQRPDLFALLARLNIDISKIGSELAELHKNNLAYKSRNALPRGKALTPRGKRIIEYAFEEARGLRHNVVDTEDILLGVLREQEAWRLRY